MGMWGFEAWDNDGAADWFGGLMSGTGLRDQWHATITQEFYEDEAEEVRAAVWLFAQLGHVYVWPIANYDEDVQLALDVADKLLASSYLREEVPKFLEGIQRDRDAIAARKKE